MPWRFEVQTLQGHARSEAPGSVLLPLPAPGAANNPWQPRAVSATIVTALYPLCVLCPHSPTDLNLTASAKTCFQISSHSQFQADMNLIWGDTQVSSRPKSVIYDSGDFSQAGAETKR